ncbi:MULTISPECIES: LexA family protein [Pasteurellaceae]|uniref:S24 family peptidase n=1 Tax=Pasteurella atlantica TaxID=2827233 RepID=A0AAW8CKR9_9PAST|nr:S24 family peptidase [Pasteurella atlantica]MBR0574649.1 transcriptional regulator [Pasteurella atlantica]MDP8040561.1 S24 family peptidase [Pasteurella atlantica]MDP8042685.1 S24 family peptidase [Pasteurella atlantica]MDP8044779.1 S24 family peptidase [Pasteurella atlantica]MDP8046874.1 S24 family peptidase [Pasteurella atlantica]
MAQLRKLTHALPYQPMPLYRDTHTERSIKLDLNSLCIKRPTDTFFIQVKNPNLLVWGIELDDVLIVEENCDFQINDMIVIEKNNEYKFYQFFNENEQEKILFSLDTSEPNLRIQQWNDINIAGVITNVVHQVRTKMPRTPKYVV